MDLTCFGYGSDMLWLCFGYAQERTLAAPMLWPALDNGSRHGHHALRLVKKCPNTLSAGARRRPAIESDLEDWFRCQKCVLLCSQCIPIDVLLMSRPESCLKSPKCSRVRHFGRKLSVTACRSVLVRFNSASPGVLWLPHQTPP